MGVPSAPPPVKLVVGILGVSRETIGDARLLLQEEFGRVDLTSESVPFGYSSYYAPEMGPTLLRQWVSHEKLFFPDGLAAKKLETNEIEKSASRDGKRRINLDPGYLTGSTLVLATTKEAAHRIYLGSGIYAEVTLLYKLHSWRFLEWTYPDYREEVAISFFCEVRRQYLEQLKEQR
jgi:hypothetical protein